MTPDMDLIADALLEHSSVVANCAMNRERELTGSNGYGRELGFDVLVELRQRLRRLGHPASVSPLTLSSMRMAVAKVCVGRSLCLCD